MGSLKMLQPTLHRSGEVVKFNTKKPVANLLGVLQYSSDPNHSPIGSPPTEKKRVRRFSNSLLASGRKSGSPTQPEDKENMHEQASSLTRPILKTTTARPTCLFSSSPTRCSHRRRVDFSGKVLVKYIGDTDTSFEPVNTEFRDWEGFLARNALRRLQAHAHEQGLHLPPVDMPSASTTAFTQHVLPSSSSSSPLTSKTVNISFSQNSRNITVMKFVVFMGPQYDPSNIVVKANMSGTRLRVVASIMPSRGQQQQQQSTEQYNERFQLPMQVDPYKVEARLDARGYLTVTAPMIEPAPGSAAYL